MSLFVGLCVGGLHVCLSCLVVLVFDCCGGLCCGLVCWLCLDGLYLCLLVLLFVCCLVVWFGWCVCMHWCSLRIGGLVGCVAIVACVVLFACWTVARLFVRLYVQCVCCVDCGLFCGLTVCCVWMCVIAWLLCECVVACLVNGWLVVLLMVVFASDIACQLVGLFG